MQKSFWIALLFLFYSSFAYPLPTDLKFNNISSKDGLSNDFVSCMFMDYKGFLWIGTNGSLNRYDGIRFNIYEKVYNDSTSLSNNQVTCIFEDRDKQLWIGTNEGLNLYDRKRDNFIRFIHNENDPRSISHNRISSVFQDSGGNLWIGTFGGGLNIYDTKHREFKSFHHNTMIPNSLCHENITSIAEDNDGNIWIGTIKGLNLIINKEQGLFRLFTYSNKQDSLHGVYITCLKNDRSGNLLIGTRDKGLYLLHQQKYSYAFEHITGSGKKNCDLSSVSVLSMYIDENNVYWIGSENSGLYLYDYHYNTVFNYRNDPDNEQSISNNSIWHIYKGNDQIIWLSSYNKGIDFFDPNYSRFDGLKFSKKSNSISSNNITWFSEDKNGNIWISTDGGGLNEFNRNNNRFKSYLHNSRPGSISTNAALCVQCDDEGNVWCGTWDGGLNVLRKDGTFQNFRKGNQEGCFHGNNIISLSKDKQGRIWIGTIGWGLYFFEKATGKFNQVLKEGRDSEDLKFANVWCQMHDKDRNIWIGTSSGVFRIKEISKNNFKVKYYQHNPLDKKSISENLVKTIFQDQKGIIWIGTDGGGLNKFEPLTETFIKYLESDGLPDNSICGIIEDNLGYLWISTNKGICRFSPEKNVFRIFDRRDGLFSNIFSGNAILKTSKGELFFGSYNGINYLNPEKICNNQYVPKVYIVDVKVNNESVPINKKGSPLTISIIESEALTLNYKQNVFTLEFAALSYSHPEKNQYSYILEGFDEKWNSIGNRHSATYTNLKPGTYIFKVKGSNNDGVWNENPTLLKIKVLPPYWKSVYALVIYSLIVLSLVYAFIMFRISQSRIKDRMKLERLRIEHEEELYKNKIQFFTNISHEFRTPLSLILSPLEQVLKSANLNKDIYSKILIALRNSQRLLRLVDELMDFSKIENRKFKLNLTYSNIVDYVGNIKEFFNEKACENKIDFNFSTDQNPVFVWFDRKRLDKVFFNLLSNAFKFTPVGGKIDINVNYLRKNESVWNSFAYCSELNESCVLITVSDTGIGIPEEYYEKIFESFYQINDRNIDSSGTGIGLALSKSIVELHGGSISVQSIKGCGSVFRVFLPLEKKAGEKNSVENTLSINGKSLKDIDFSEELPDSDYNENNFQKNFSVMIVEDNSELRKYLKTELKDEFIIYEAKSGLEAYNILLKKQPDIVISDIKMDNGNGLELCSKIKNNDNINHIPVILLTAKTTLNDKIAGIETGADAYITKPFSIGLLKAQINQLISSRKLLIAKLASSHDMVINPNTTGNEQQFITSFKSNVLHRIEDQDLSVEKLSLLMNLSRSQIYRKVKSVTGLSPNDYIKVIRLEVAKNILEKQSVTVVETSSQVGFSSPSYFTKCFKEAFGILPIELINKKKEDAG